MLFIIYSIKSRQFLEDEKEFHSSNNSIIIIEGEKNENLISNGFIQFGERKIVCILKLIVCDFYTFLLLHTMNSLIKVS